MEKIKFFLNKNNIDFILNFDSSEISTMRIGAKIAVAIFPRNEDEFVKILLQFYRLKIKYRVIGNASNILFESDICYPVIFTNKMNDLILVDGNVVSVSAGMVINKFFDVLRKNCFSGLESLVGIPATIGGAIRNNAGAFGGAISDHLIKIKVFFCGKIFELKKDEIKFGYHFSNLSGFIIISATFLFEKKKGV